MARPDSARLNCEALEARDVPAVVLNATLNAARNDAAPDGGLVSISELQLAPATQLRNRSFATVTGQTRSATANDVVSFSLAGNTLTIASSDGIFGQVTNSNNALVFYGNTLSIPNVSGLSVGLQLGGNDSVTDNTTLPTTIDAGPGSDTIRVVGTPFNPALVPLLYAPGGLEQLMSLGLFSSPAKTLNGGDGNDNLAATGLQVGANLFGGNGDDALTIDSVSGLGLLDGGSGNDTLTGPLFGAFTTLRGGDGDDNIRGPQTGRTNFLQGGTGRDTIIGGSGTDIIDGGTGIDILVGLGGNDTYSTIDVDFDYILNQSGDTVAADPFDFRRIR